MHTIDYLIMFSPLVALLFVALSSRRYVRSVADYLAASRCAGRYVLCNAGAEAGVGVISVVATFEVLSKTGFVMTWWTAVSTLVMLMMVLTGFVVYRRRETRTLTLAQFFEVRYSKSFRIFLGLLAFIGGILNYGIFPAVSARFFIFFCGWPQTFVLGGVECSTFAVVMAAFIGVALAFTLIGGQLTVIISDCLAGLIAGFFYMIVAGAILLMFNWSEMYSVLAQAPPGQSMLDPFDINKQQDFNFGYVIVGMITGIYRYGGWHAGQGFINAASSSHEAKMSGILSNWRVFSHTVLFTLLGIGAYTFLKHPEYMAGASRVQEILQQIPQEALRVQMSIPTALGVLLPVGIKGMLACVMLFLMVGCDGNYMHSWGSVFFQDVVLPFRKKPLEPRQHIWILRACVGGVAVFAYCFGLFFKQTEYIVLFFAITGAIYGAGAGAVLIGGLYWKKGTTAAAWTSMIAGSGLAVVGIICQQLWAQVRPWLLDVLGSGRLHDWFAANPDRFPINGVWIGFIAAASSTILYVAVSLLTSREDFNMDRMLHRGKYAMETTPDKSPDSVARRKFTWGSLMGFDREFTRGDKLISGGMFVWTWFWFAVFVVVTVWNLFHRWPLEWWGRYWHLTQIFLPFAIGIFTTIWFTWGGIRDLRRMFVALNSVKRNALDSGMVVGHRNLDEVAAETRGPK
jgi:SSS family solute:Na+ symporter